MNTRGLHSLPDIRDVRTVFPHRHAAGHPHFWERAISRRRFVGTAAGAAAAGAALGAGLWQPVLATGKRGTGTPKPIPGGSPVIEELTGQLFHVFGPALLDPPDAEPSSITDFVGSVGLAFISGNVTRRNRSTGETVRLPFVDADMRFMKGIFQDTEGKAHIGAFGLI